MQFSFYCYLPDLPYSRELCIKCRSCYRGIHSDCLTQEECDLLDSDGICCSACISSKKKRALTFPSNSQRFSPPLPPTHNPSEKCLFSIPSIAVNRVKFKQGVNNIKGPNSLSRKKPNKHSEKDKSIIFFARTKHCN